MPTTSHRAGLLSRRRGGCVAGVQLCGKYGRRASSTEEEEEACDARCDRNANGVFVITHGLVLEDLCLDLC